MCSRRSFFCTLLRTLCARSRVQKVFSGWRSRLQTLTLKLKRAEGSSPGIIRRAKPDQQDAAQHRSADMVAAGQVH